MSYDAMAGYLYELNSDVFSETIPGAYQTFLEVLERHDIGTDDVAQAITYDDWFMTDLEDPAIEEIEASYKQVQRMFEAKTGLKVSLTYIDEDSGSQYNDVSGAVWGVDNAIQLTEPARTFERFIEQKFFCLFG